MSSAERSRERLQSSDPVPPQPEQRAAKKRRHSGRQVEPPPGTQQRGPVEQNGGTQLCLQDGAPDGSNDSLLIDLNAGAQRFGYISKIEPHKSSTRVLSLLIRLQFCYEIKAIICIV